MRKIVNASCVLKNDLGKFYIDTPDSEQVRKSVAI